MESTMANSSKNGLSLEYACAHVLTTMMPLHEASSARMDILRGHFNKLTIKDKSDFMVTANIIVNSILPRLVDGTCFSLGSDKAGQSGCVADIIIHRECGDINLSLKHNNNVVKSQRPSALAKQLGLSTNEYELAYKHVISKAFDAMKTYPSFKEARKQVSIQNLLYRPLTDLMLQFLKSNMNAITTNKLYAFLTGEQGLIKIIANAKAHSVTIFETIVDVPTTYEVRLVSDSTIKISFAFNHGKNDVFTFRLHTASSKITPQLSIKVDTRQIEFRNANVRHIQPVWIQTSSRSNI